MLSIEGKVIPVTRTPVNLHARLKDGSTVTGEHQIETHIWSEGSHVEKLWLEPECTLHPLALQAIKQADLIVIAPGSIFTSLIPNLLVGGMKDALKATKAPIAYVVNLMTEKGQTGRFSVQDFAALIETYLGEGQLDYVVYNSKRPERQLLERYTKEMERSPVQLDRTFGKVSYQLVGTDLLGKRIPQKQVSDLLSSTRTLIRHDPQKLADVLYALTVFKRVQKYLL